MKLKFNQYLKSNKPTSLIYADLESLINKIERIKNNWRKLSTASELGDLDEY